MLAITVFQIGNDLLGWVVSLFLIISAIIRPSQVIYTVSRDRDVYCKRRLENLQNTIDILYCIYITRQNLAKLDFPSI